MPTHLRRLHRGPRPFALAAALLALHLAIAGASGVRTAGVKQVDMVYNTFSPKELSVNIGETVEWLNRDTVPHDVTFESGPASGPAGGMGPGARWSYAFTSPGTLRYRCQVHSTGYDDGQGQVGRVKVVDPNAPSPPGSGIPDWWWIPAALLAIIVVVGLAWSRRDVRKTSDKRRAERARRRRRRG